MADGLHFLHSQANQIHRGISPEAICITAGGAWKLAGFGFAMLAEFGDSNPAEAAFDYSDSSNGLAQSLRVVHMSVVQSFGWHATYNVDICTICCAGHVCTGQCEKPKMHAASPFLDMQFISIAVLVMKG